MAQPKPPIWDRFSLTALRELPAYRRGRAGQPRGECVTLEERAAWRLGKDERTLSANFNRIAFGRSRKN